MSIFRRRLAFYDELAQAPFAEIEAQKGMPDGLAELDLQAKLKPSANPSRQPMLESTMSFRKGGKVGTNGATPIAFRFDDWQIDVRDFIGPLFWERGIPASIALCTLLTEPWQAATQSGPIDYRGRTPITWDELRDWNWNNGFEFWSHGRTHQPPIVSNIVNYPKLVNEIVGTLDDFDAENVLCMGWTKPGVPHPGYGSFLIEDEDWLTDAGRLLLDHYAITETDRTGTYRHLPSNARHGLAHTVITDGLTYAANVKRLDAAVIAKGRGMEMMLHAGNIVNGATTLAGATPGTNMTIAELETFLDLVVEYWEDGKIEVVTPSSLAYADPTSDYRLDLVPNGDLVHPVPLLWDDFYNWQNVNGTTRSVVSVSDGPGGGTQNVLRITADGRPLVIEDQMERRGMAGQTYMFHGWCRALTAGGASAAEAQVVVQDVQDTVKWTLDRRFDVGTTWTKVRFPFTPPRDTTKTGIGVGRVTGVGLSTQVEWANVHAYVA